MKYIDDAFFAGYPMVVAVEMCNTYYDVPRFENEIVDDYRYYSYVVYPSASWEG